MDVGLVMKFEFGVCRKDDDDEDYNVGFRDGDWVLFRFLLRGG